ncbi:MAG: hypothetical protein AAF236_12995, partial [Verrucomicrobiota bacterium]
MAEQLELFDNHDEAISRNSRSQKELVDETSDVAEHTVLVGLDEMLTEKARELTSGLSLARLAETVHVVW